MFSVRDVDAFGAELGGVGVAQTVGVNEGGKHLPISR